MRCVTVEPPKPCRLRRLQPETRAITYVGVSMAHNAFQINMEAYSHSRSVGYVLLAKQAQTSRIGEYTVFSAITLAASQHPTGAARRQARYGQERPAQAAQEGGKVVPQECLGAQAAGKAVVEGREEQTIAAYDGTAARYLSE